METRNHRPECTEGHGGKLNPAWFYSETEITPSGRPKAIKSCFCGCHDVVVRCKTGTETHAAGHSGSVTHCGRRIAWDVTKSTRTISCESTACGGTRTLPEYVR